MAENEKRPVRVQDGATVIENRIFRIAGRLLALSVIVAYLVLYFHARREGNPWEWTDFDISLLSLSGLAVFAIELLRYLAKKKIG